MSSSEWAAAALQSFDAVVQATEGFRSRAGQRRMAEEVAHVFSVATLGKGPGAESEAAPEQVAASDSAAAESAAESGANPGRAIAVIQAGTGVGKSLAYGAPAVALALARNTRVLISTATVALQEQLVHKDLPALAARLPQPFKFALAKGRGRYVCQLKLDRLAAPSGEAGMAEDDFFPDEEATARAAQPRHEAEARQQFYATLAQSLARGRWDGDRDALDPPPEAELWAPVAAEAASCTGKYCPAFAHCSYFEKRKELVGAQVIVVNHDLLLSSLGSRTLPELHNCLLVLDEAHHLPATALSQFASSMDLSRLGWIDRLTSRALRVATLVEVPQLADLPRHAAQLRQGVQDFGRCVLDHYGAALRPTAQGESAKPGPWRGEGWSTARVRVPRGVLPEALVEPLNSLAASAAEYLACLSAVAQALREAIRERPQEARTLSLLYAQVGTLAPRLEGLHACAQALLREAPAQRAQRTQGKDGAEGARGNAGPDVAAGGESAAAPYAKWFTLEGAGDFAVLRAHASPILPGPTLKARLWSEVRAAVLTSATLTSCGQFDFFLREAGLYGDAAVRTLEVPSPFDYSAQGTLIAAETRADPRDARAYGAEMVDALLHDLAQVQAGALVLFTSREQMRLAVEALPTALRGAVLVQNTLPRAQLLARHRTRVAAGEPSIIFGMQSFGEGLDLPGRLCESVFIAKLPFAPPDDPVGEARAEWLRAVGRDPFSELVVPATAIRLAQWVGRAIRTEQDQAHVYCYDRRLTRTAYGQRLLQGLPPFALQQRAAG